MNMRVPFEIRDIDKSNELFGRTQLLKNLQVDAALKQNVNIIGERRFGKTCILKTSYTILKTDEVANVYPIFIDLKTEDIHGTNEVYRYFIGKLVETLCNDRIMTDAISFGSITIYPSSDWTDISQNLETLSSSRIQSLFQKIIMWFSELLDKTILFMIDEYEYLFKVALDQPTGFMKLRALSSNTNSNGQKPFCFWLTGSSSWDELINDVPGSGEANTISAHEYVTPLTRESFNEMWESECKCIEDDSLREILYGFKEFAFEKSGGVPFYGKVIGADIYKNKKAPDYTICNSVFKELTTKAMSAGHYKILKELVASPRKIANSNYRDSLLNKGIIALKTKDIYYIPIAFLVDFIQAELNDINSKAQTLPESYTLVNRITKTIELINKQRINYKKEPVFKAVIDGASQENSLRTPCSTIEQLADFSSALYNIYFERSKEGRGDLHYKFFSEDTFAKCVNIARHSIGKGHEMDNFIVRDGQFSRADLYVEIMGDADEIHSPQECSKFQIEMLKRFLLTLESMFKYMKENKS
jgi:hypothetical protein